MQKPEHVGRSHRCGQLQSCMQMFVLVIFPRMLKKKASISFQIWQKSFQAAYISDKTVRLEEGHKPPACFWQSVCIPVLRGVSRGLEFELQVPVAALIPRPVLKTPSSDLINPFKLWGFSGSATWYFRTLVLFRDWLVHAFCVCGRGHPRPTPC